MLAVNLYDLGQHLLALAYVHYVEKVGERLGVDGARSARDENGIAFVTVFGVERYARQVEHIEDIRVQHFVLHRKPHHVELRKGRFGLDGRQGKPRFPKKRRTIQRGRKTALALRSVHIVDAMIEKPKPQIAHPHLVEVGHTKAKAHALFGHRGAVILPAHVSRGLVYPRPNARIVETHGITCAAAPTMPASLKKRGLTT